MDLENREKRSNDLSEDLNIKAYEADVDGGTFSNYEPGTFVAYNNGGLVGSAKDREQLFKELREKGVEGFFYHQVGVPEEIIDVPTPLWIGDIE